MPRLKLRSTIASAVTLAVLGISYALSVQPSWFEMYNELWLEHTTHVDDPPNNLLDDDFTELLDAQIIGAAQGDDFIGLVYEMQYTHRIFDSASDTVDRSQYKFAPRGETAPVTIPNSVVRRFTGEGAPEPSEEEVEAAALDTDDPDFEPWPGLNDTAGAQLRATHIIPDLAFCDARTSYLLQQRGWVRGRGEAPFRAFYHIKDWEIQQNGPGEGLYRVSFTEEWQCDVWLTINALHPNVSAELDFTFNPQFLLSPPGASPWEEMFSTLTPDQQLDYKFSVSMTNGAMPRTQVGSWSWTHDGFVEQAIGAAGTFPVLIADYQDVAGDHNLNQFSALLDILGSEFTGDYDISVEVLCEMRVTGIDITCVDDWEE